VNEPSVLASIPQWVKATLLIGGCSFFTLASIGIIIHFISRKPNAPALAETPAPPPPVAASAQPKNPAKRAAPVPPPPAKKVDDFPAFRRAVSAWLDAVRPCCDQLRTLPSPVFFERAVERAAGKAAEVKQIASRHSGDHIGRVAQVVARVQASLQRSTFLVEMHDTCVRTGDFQSAKFLLSVFKIFGLAFEDARTTIWPYVRDETPATAEEISNLIKYINESMDNLDKVVETWEKGGRGEPAQPKQPEQPPPPQIPELPQPKQPQRPKLPGELPGIPLPGDKGNGPQLPGPGK
jgi:hypothetical protein